MLRRLVRFYFRLRYYPRRVEERLASHSDMLTGIAERLDGLSAAVAGLNRFDYEPTAPSLSAHVERMDEDGEAGPTSVADEAPTSQPDGCDEIELVIETIEVPAATIDDDPRPALTHLPAPDAWRSASTEGVVQNRGGGTLQTRVLPASPWNVALYDFGSPQPPRRRILAMQLGHMGDFIIGLPALRQLREAFPDDQIRLVTGTWNRGVAESTGLVDEVATHNHFPEVARGWNGRPVQDADEFARTAPGHYDIAVDLRVDDDTRHLLLHADAAMRCGIGTISRFPFLDAALPISRPAAPAMGDAADILLMPGRFRSRMSHPGPVRQTHNYRRTNTHVIFGPGLALPVGSYRAVFSLSLTGIRTGPRPIRIGLDVLQGGTTVLAERVFQAADVPSTMSDGMFLDFTNEDDTAPLDYRVHVVGRPLLARLAFGGVRLERQAVPHSVRRRASSLHIGEQLSLLVQLVADRAQRLHAPLAAPRPVALPLHVAVPTTRWRVVVAPVSNSDLRDWPPGHYAKLVGMLADHLDCTVLLTGSGAQAPTLRRIAQDSGAGDRVIDLAGTTQWTDLPDILRGADLVICNNSGVAHLAASLGVRTLALYSASHQPQEWGPRGAQSRALMAVVPCSPCGLDRLAECPHGHACMQELLPDTVFKEVQAWLAQPGGA